METKVWTLDEIKRSNRLHGRFYFDPATVRAFKSRPYDRVWQGNGMILFVDSVKRDRSEPREYKVVRFDPEDGCMSYEVTGLTKLEHAKREAERLTKE